MQPRPRYHPIGGNGRGDAGSLERVSGRQPYNLRFVNSLELHPNQPPPVAQAIAAIVEQAAPEPDPWWSEGNREALET